MLLPPFQKALVLTGPTGSGKSQLGIELAECLEAEIVSMDSMAIYRGMDILTAKPTSAQRACVPHHLIDVLEPSQSGSEAWWLDEAKRCCQNIESRGKSVLFVGGTPLYLKALISGLFDGPPGDEAIRHQLMQEAELIGGSELHRRLSAIDPVCAGRIHPNDLRRVIRALEVFELTGKPMGEWQTQWRGGQWGEPTVAITTSEKEESVGVPATLWLDLPREELYARIDQRVIEMFAGGLVEEVRRLRSLDPALSPEASKSLGYSVVVELLESRITLADAVARIQTGTRNFAKRQMTWFRHLPDCRPVSKELTSFLWQPKMKR